MKIAHIITEGRKRLVEGGNLSVNGHEAQHLDLKVTDRNFIVPVLNNLLLAINQGFKKQYKQDLWSPALLKSQEFLSGSSLHFFNVKGIPDETFVSKKPTVGDMDTMVDKTKEPQLQEFLTANQNKQIGPATLRGFKRGNEQFSSLWELQEPPIKIQIDFEFVAFENEKPTDWARFSHSSSWEDLQAGVKGVFHKWLIQSLAALTRKDFYLRKMVGRGKARQEEDVPTTDNMYSFAVSSKEGGGLRPKYEPVIDASTGKPVMKDGLSVMTASPTSGYEKDINKIFQSLLGQRISPEAAKSASQKFWSFTGLVDIVKELCTPQEKEQIVQAFLQKTIGPGSQGMYKNNPDKDISEKTLAINYLLSALKMPKPANLDQMLKDYRTTYKTDADDDNTAKAKSNDVVKGMAKNALDEATAPDYKRKGIQHIYNPGNSMEMKDAEFIDMCKEIASMGGKLDNAPINLKIDGAGIKFGKDSQGKPFFMTSKVTEPKYAENYGDFEKYGRSTGQDEERLNFTKNYDEALKTIVNADFMKDIPNDTIVQAEMLFTPMGKKEQGGLKFVNIPYDQKKLGTVMTLVPFSVKQYSTGETRPDQDKIKQALVKDSTKEIKMVNNQLQQNNVDVGAIVNPIAKNADKLLAAVKTRGDSEQKTKAHEILTQARKQLSDAIIENPNIQGKDQLGKNIEGLVLNLPSGRLAKVTSPEMKDKMAAKQAAGNKKPTTGGNRNKTAVVTVGSFSGHKGHQQLIDQTINMANQVGGDPYIYVSPVVGPDDPIPANMKVATLQKLYPEYANNIQVWNSAGTPVKKIEKELVLPPNSPYNKIILIVGSDRYDGFKKWMDSLENRMKDPEAIKKYGGTQNQVDYETIKSERAAGKGGTGISFTRLRDILKDPNASEQDKLNLWSKAFDTDKLGINWIKKLMDTTAQNMNISEQDIEVEGFLNEFKFPEDCNYMDKISMIESYVAHNGNLTESNSGEDNEQFLSLVSMSSKPVIDEKFILLSLVLQNGKVHQLQFPNVVTVLDTAGDDRFTAKHSDGRIEKYPKKIQKVNISAINLLFDSAEAYDRFRTMLELRFDKSLADPDFIKGVSSDGKIDESKIKDLIKKIKPLLGESTSEQKEKFFNILSEVKTRLDPKCWKGYHKKGTKIKSGTRVNNCVPNESVSSHIHSDKTPKLHGLSFKELDRLSESAGTNNYAKFDQALKKNLNLPNHVNTLETYGVYVRKLDENKITQEEHPSEIEQKLFSILDQRSSADSIDSAKIGDKVALLHLSTLNIPEHKIIARLNGFLNPKEIVKITENNGSFQQLEFADGSKYPEKDNDVFKMIQSWNMTKLFPSQDTASKAYTFYALMGKELSKVLDFDANVKQGVAEGSPQPGQAVVDAILKVMPVAQEIWFHGSRANGKHRRNSDTDILVVVPDNLVGDQYLGVVRILQKLSSHFDNYDIQPAKSGNNIHRIAQEEGQLLWSNKQGVAEGWKDAAVGGVMALGALGAGSGHAAAQTMPNINAQQVELTKKYYDILVKRAIEDDMELDTRTKNRLMAKAQDAAQLKIQQNNQSQSNPQGAVEPPQNKPKPSITNFPSISSERRVSKGAGQYESQDRAESSKENITENADYLEEK